MNKKLHVGLALLDPLTLPHRIELPQTSYVALSSLDEGALEV